MIRQNQPDHPQEYPGPRAFTLRIRPGYGTLRQDFVVTLDDIDTKQKKHFTTLEAAFAEIRKALNVPDPRTGKPH